MFLAQPSRFQVLISIAKTLQRRSYLLQDGYYLFDKLVPGKYDISIVPSSGFELVQSMILNLTLQSGQSYLNYDIPVF